MLLPQEGGLLAHEPCEGELVIAAINQVGQRKTVRLLGVVLSRGVGKCSGEVIAGPAGCWQRWVTTEWRGSPAPEHYRCGPHFQDNKVAGSPEKEAPPSWGLSWDCCEKPVYFCTCVLLFRTGVPARPLGAACPSASHVRGKRPRPCCLPDANPRGWPSQLECRSFLTNRTDLIQASTFPQSALCVSPGWARS